jgi:hypothetical protein
MPKVQPNFSWQKYEGEQQDRENQFQHQLQQEHITVANAINTTIDDLSYFTTERVTGFLWVNNAPIYTKTIQGVIVGTADTAFPTGITGLVTLVSLTGTAQDAATLTVGIPLPYLDPGTLANGVGIYLSGTDLHVKAGNNTRNNYFFSVTLMYTKK